MATVRPFEPMDLFKFNNVNLDPFTETYGLSFYLHYLINWPEYFQVAENHDGTMMGYTVTVAAQYRRMGLAARLMENLERVSEARRCYFVDLFVRVSNATACTMYKALGYTIYRQIMDYYAPSGTDDKSSDVGMEQSEDAYDMRKALSRDVDRNSVRPLKNAVVTASEIEFD